MRTFKVAQLPAWATTHDRVTTFSIGLEDAAGRIAQCSITRGWLKRYQPMIGGYVSTHGNANILGQCGYSPIAPDKLSDWGDSEVSGIKADAQDSSYRAETVLIDVIQPITAGHNGLSYITRPATEDEIKALAIELPPPVVVKGVIEPAKLVPEPLDTEERAIVRDLRAEVSRLTNKLTVQTKLTRDAEAQRDGLKTALADEQAAHTATQVRMPERAACIEALHGALVQKHEALESECEQLHARLKTQTETITGLYERIDEQDKTILDLVDELKADDGQPEMADAPAIARDSDTAFMAYDLTKSKLLAMSHDELEALDTGTLAQLHTWLVAGESRKLAEYGQTYRYFGAAQYNENAQPSRGVSIPAAELAVTEQEDEAFKAKWPILKFKSFEGFTGAHTQGLLSSAETGDSSTETARSSTEIRLDDIEQRMERAENAYLVLQGRVNTHGDRFDALKAI